MFTHHIIHVLFFHSLFLSFSTLSPSVVTLSPVRVKVEHDPDGVNGSFLYQQQDRASVHVNDFTLYGISHLPRL